LSFDGDSIFSDSSKLALAGAIGIIGSKGSKRAEE